MHLEQHLHIGRVSLHTKFHCSITFLSTPSKSYEQWNHVLTKGAANGTMSSQRELRNFMIDSTMRWYELEDATLAAAPAAAAD